MTKPTPKLPNKVRCKMHGVELESKYRHDFRQCQCPNGAFVDGGQDYCRTGGMDLSMGGMIVWTTKGWQRVQSPPIPPWYNRLWSTFKEWIRSLRGWLSSFLGS